MVMQCIVPEYLKVDEKKEDAKDNKDKKKKDEASDNEKDDSAAEDKAVVKWDSLSLQIYDGERLIRTLKQKAPEKSGIHKWTWYMDEAGVERPSKSTRKRNNEPGGASVKPGKYKAVLTFGDLRSEEMITVKTDPRLDVSSANINEVYAASKELENMQQTAADAVKQLVESKKIAEAYQSDLKKLDKNAYKEQIKASKDIMKKIDDIIDIYLGKEDKRQGITRNPEITVMERLGNANGYVQSRQNGLTTTENTLIKHAKDELNSALDKTNTFFNNDWKTYQSTMESLKASPFKETKTFKLN